MSHGEHPGLVHRADGPTAVGVDERVLDRRSGAQPDPRRGRVAARPVEAATAGLEQVVLHQLSHHVGEALAEPRFVLGHKRHLVGRAPHLRPQHEGVFGVDHRSLGRALGQLGRMGRVPLVEQVVARHHHRGSAPTLTSGAPGLLPHRGEGSGEAVEHHRVDPADVYPELQRVGGRDSQEAARSEVGLERPTLGGEIAGPVSGDAVRQLAVVAAERAERVARRSRSRAGSG